MLRYLRTQLPHSLICRRALVAATPEQFTPELADVQRDSEPSNTSLLVARPFRLQHSLPLDELYNASSKQLRTCHIKLVG